MARMKVSLMFKNRKKEDFESKKHGYRNINNVFGEENRRTMEKPTLLRITHCTEREKIGEQRCATKMDDV